jgi:peptidoglycan/LPS O-acetylase OafA/YrhL
MLLAVLSSWLVHTDKQPRWLWNPVMPWLSWLLAIAMLWAVSHIGVSRLPLEHTAPGRGLLQEVLYGLFAFFLLLPAVFGPQRRGLIRRGLQFTPVAALGVVSYGVYLWHQAWVMLFLRWTGGLFRVALPEIFGAVFGLAVVSATASYLLVERPILNLKDRLGWWNISPRVPGPVPQVEAASAVD